VPLTPPGVAAPLLASLVSFGHLGTHTPTLAQGIAQGVVTWALSVTVTTVDVGTAGAGVGLLPLPPPPTLLATMQAGFLGQGIVGIFAPLTANAIASGLTAGFPQALITTTHPTVGAGTAVATFTAAPAVTFLLAGFASVGWTGAALPQLASAIGFALDTAFASHVVPIPIVGPPSPVASGGFGFGSLL